jgi:hypothetical protein
MSILADSKTQKICSMPELYKVFQKFQLYDTYILWQNTSHSRW